MLSSVGCSAPERTGMKACLIARGTIAPESAKGASGVLPQHLDRVVFPTSPEQGGCLHLFVLFCCSRRLSPTGCVRYQTPATKAAAGGLKSHRGGKPAAGPPLRRGRQRFAQHASHGSGNANTGLTSGPWKSGIEDQQRSFSLSGRSSRTAGSSREKVIWIVSGEIEEPIDPLGSSREWCRESLGARTRTLKPLGVSSPSVQRTARDQLAACNAARLPAT